MFPLTLRLLVKLLPLCRGDIHEIFLCNALNLALNLNFKHIGTLCIQHKKALIAIELLLLNLIKSINCHRLAFTDTYV